MKIAVFTHSGTDDNYGQVLQCFALQKYLLSLGHDVALARYRSDNDCSKERFALMKNVLRSMIRLLSKSRRAKYAELQKIVNLRRINTVKNKQRKFVEFNSEHIRKCADYGSYREVLENPPRVDACIVGSDQVWLVSPKAPSSKVWFLDFGRPDMRRISYAASIGRRLDKKQLKVFGKQLNRFDAVSVREISAMEDCKAAGREDACVTLDPTLLAGAEIYRSFISMRTADRPYVFCYYLNVTTADEIAWSQIEEYLNESGSELVPVSSSGYLPADELIPGHENRLLTIPEWLNGVYNAQAVVTTSFHGVAFAILMHRPFVAIPLKGAYAGGNVRIESLLECLGLIGRILRDGATVSTILAEEINWESVDAKLDRLRESSAAFLKEALA